MKKYTIELWEIPGLIGSIEMPILAKDDKHALLKSMKFAKSVAELMEDEQIEHDEKDGDLYCIAITLGEGWRKDVYRFSTRAFIENSRDIPMPNNNEYHTMEELDEYIKMYSE